jgi:hypothetical protein
MASALVWQFGHPGDEIGVDHQLALAIHLDRVRARHLKTNLPRVYARRYHEVMLDSPLGAVV